MLLVVVVAFLLHNSFQGHPIHVKHDEQMHNGENMEKAKT